MIKLLLGIVALAYPFIIYFGLQATTVSALALVLGAIVLLRALVTKRAQRGISPFHLAAILVVPLFCWGYFFQSEVALKLYPVVVNLCFLLVFGYSLWAPPSVVTRLASLRESLDEQGVAYTYKVTQVWCLFFILNGGIALWSVFHPNPRFWVVYNGFISYMLIALLFAIEWLVRRKVKQKHD